MRYAPALDLLNKNEAKGLFVTDLHYPHCDRAFLRKYFQKDYDFIIFGGDITEGSTYQSPGASLNFGSEKQAIAMFEEDLKLINPKTRKEMVLGNHDTRASRMTGQDVVAIEKTCNMFNIQLSDNHTILPVRLGTRNNKPCLFKIMITHGHGGGATDQAPLNALKRVRECVDTTCDLYLCGHFHKYIWMSDDFRGSIINPNGKLRPIVYPQFLGACGSPMRWEGSYAEGTTKSRPYKSTVVNGLEIVLSTGRAKNNTTWKQIQHVALYS